MPDVADGIPMPPHVYVPGQSPRHPEDWFDPIKASVTPEMSAQALADTAAFRAGLAYLSAGYFWECHEVLEAVWMQTPAGSPERDMVQALIQLANARLKVLMARTKAALRLCDMVDGHLHQVPVGQEVLSLRPESVAAWVAQLRQEILSI